MSDARLRELERRWRASRSVTDEAAYLAELVRSGGLVKERLALAAHCGHPAAVMALPGSAAVPSLDEAWVRGLERAGRAALVRASIAATRAALAAELQPGAETPRTLAALALVESCLRANNAELAAMALHVSAGNAIGLPARIGEACLGAVARPDPAAQAAEALRLAIAGLGVEWVRAVVQEELVPWLLGRGDPLTERSRR